MRSGRHLDIEERFRTPELLVQYGIRRAMNVILSGDGSPFGVLEVDSRSEGEFNDSHSDTTWAVTMWEAGPMACRWPVTDANPIDDFRFCGAPAVDGGSWCQFHCARFARQ
jgi:hypothetical protein